MNQLQLTHGYTTNYHESWEETWIAGLYVHCSFNSTVLILPTHEVSISLIFPPSYRVLGMPTEFLTQ